MSSNYIFPSVQEISEHFSKTVKIHIPNDYTVIQSKELLPEYIEGQNYLQQFQDKINEAAKNLANIYISGKSAEELKSINDRLNGLDPDGPPIPLPQKSIPERTINHTNHNFIGALYRPYESPI